MSMIGDTHTFPVPSLMTQAERVVFSQHTGRTLEDLEALFDDPTTIGVAVTAEIWAGLVLLSARRVDPSITYDQALAKVLAKEWTLGKPDNGPDSPLADVIDLSSRRQRAR